ncbi:hypothetical protein HK405_007554, partial [Cladochytrium tenue]
RDFHRSVVAQEAKRPATPSRAATVSAATAAASPTPSRYAASPLGERPVSAAASAFGPLTGPVSGPSLPAAASDQTSPVALRSLTSPPRRQAASPPAPHAQAPLFGPPRRTLPSSPVNMRPGTNSSATGGPGG